MDWVTSNWFFLGLIVLCIGMHLFHGHGGHGSHGADDDDGTGDPRDESSHRHH